METHRERERASTNVGRKTNSYVSKRRICCAKHSNPFIYLCCASRLSCAFFGHSFLPRILFSFMRCFRQNAHRSFCVILFFSWFSFYVLLNICVLDSVCVCVCFLSGRIEVNMCTDESSVYLCIVLQLPLIRRLRSVDSVFSCDEMGTLTIIVKCECTSRGFSLLNANRQRILPFRRATYIFGSQISYSFHWSLKFMWILRDTHTHTQ